MNIPALSKKARQIVCILSVFLLFIPKINLVQIGGETAGLRFDDLLLGLFFLFLVAGMLLARKASFNRLELLWALLVGTGLISNGINLYLFNRSSGLYSLRLVEYFLFFYAGYYYAISNSLTRLAKWLLIVNGSVMLLQQVGLIGAATSDGLVSSVQERPVGLTGGPWEIGAIINFCFAILIFDDNRAIRRKYVLWLFAGTMTLVLITASRMALIAQLLLLTIYFYRKSRNAFRFISIAISALAMILAALIFIPNPVAARSENLFTIDNFSSFQRIYASTPDNPQVEGLASFASDDGGDLSWLIRAAKWTAAIKGWNRSFLSIIFGVGPGALGPSLDGGWLRILSEMGVAGFLIFSIFCRYIAVQFGWQMRGVLLALSTSMLMIDIHIAYKAMSTFFFILGYCYYAKIAPISHKEVKRFPVFHEDLRHINLADPLVR